MNNRYCTACGKPLPEPARFCPACGVAQQQATVTAPSRRNWRRFFWPLLAVVVAIALLSFAGHNGTLQRMSSSRTGPGNGNWSIAEEQGYMATCLGSVPPTNRLTQVCQCELRTFEVRFKAYGDYQSWQRSSADAAGMRITADTAAGCQV
ncbi:MAG TPA: zinc ribbon domain-containing protein [Dehalococcoidia bacterium]|nr:zinc ribbon domain-containing protein [Dehalococcoidia bacterium]